MKRASVILITGERLRMSPRQSWLLLTDINSLAYFAITISLVGYCYALYSPFDVQWWQYVVGFSVVGLLFVTLLFLVAAVLTSALSQHPRILGPSSITTFIALAGMEVGRRNHSYFLWGSHWVETQTLPQQIVSDFFIVLVLEYVYCRFVLPTTEVYPALQLPASTPSQAQPVNNGSQLPEAGNQDMVVDELIQVSETVFERRDEQISAISHRTGSTRVVLAGQSFAMDHIKIIRADEHYIHVTTETETTMLRVRFGDAVSQLPVRAGLQVHRSFWVSYDFIASSRRQADGRLLLSLADGSLIAVPRARKSALEQLLIEHTGLDDEA